MLEKVSAEKLGRKKFWTAFLYFGGKKFGQVFSTEKFFQTNISQTICSKFHAKVKLNTVDIENEVNFEVERGEDFLIDETDGIILID